MCGGGARTIDKQALILSLGGGPSYAQCSEMEGGRKGGKREFLKEVLKGPTCNLIWAQAK